jgi:hypothetical protein
MPVEDEAMPSESGRQAERGGKYDRKWYPVRKWYLAGAALYLGGSFVVAEKVIGSHQWGLGIAETISIVGVLIMIVVFDRALRR